MVYNLFFLSPPQSLQSQMMGRQTAVETLRKTCDSLMSCEGELLSHPEEIQETVGEQDASEHHGSHRDTALWPGIVQLGSTGRDRNVISLGTD